MTLVRYTIDDHALRNAGHDVDLLRSATDALISDGHDPETVEQYIVDSLDCGMFDKSAPEFARTVDAVRFDFAMYLEAVS